MIYCTLGNFSKPVIILPELPTFQAIFVQVSKSFIFLVESFLGNFYKHLVTGHTATYLSTYNKVYLDRPVWNSKSALKLLSITDDRRSQQCDQIGENLPFWQKLQSLVQFFEGLFTI